MKIDKKVCLYEGNTTKTHIVKAVRSDTAGKPAGKDVICPSEVVLQGYHGRRRFVWYLGSVGQTLNACQFICGTLRHMCIISAREEILIYRFSTIRICKNIIWRRDKCRDEFGEFY